MGDKIRIGILGQGFIGSVYREVLFQLNNFQVVCVAEPVEASLKCLSGVKVVSDYRKLLDDARDLDAVVNALPTTLHLQSVRDTADCGLPMLLEKPMGIHSEEAGRIKTARSGIKLMVGMTGRYHPEFVRAHEMIGKIGEILQLNERIHFGGIPFPSQYLDTQQCGYGVGLTNGVHTIDRFLWYMNDNIASVSVDHIGNEFFHKDVEDNIRGEILFSNGKLGLFSLRWSPHQETDYVFEAVGSEGIIRVYGFDRAVLIQGDKSTELYRHNQDVDFRERHKPGLTAELEAFAEFLQGNKPTRHVDDCIKAQKVIDHFYRSAMGA